MSGDLGFSIKYKIRNHINNKTIVIKNKLGMIADIYTTDPLRRGEEGQCWIDVELHLFDLRNVNFNVDMVTNKLDKAILNAIMERIEEIKRTNVTLDLYSRHLGEKVLIHVNLGGINCNYKYNGFQSDVFGFTLEFKDEAYPGYYKEDEYQDNLKDIIEEHEIHKCHKNNFVRDFVFRLYRIVDNERTIGPLWVQSGGEFLQINPILDDSKSSGIYIYKGTGGTPVKIIPPEDITPTLLSENGLTRNKYELEQLPHNKLYINLIKENNTLKSKIKELEKELEARLLSYKENTAKMGETIARDSFKIEELIRQLNRTKESIKENKERDTFITQQQTYDHKREIEKLKENNTRDNLGNFIKILKDMIPAISGFMKLFV